MSEGKWSGGAANRSWARYAGAREISTAGDAERGARLFALLASTEFLCETCGTMHALAEHRQCRSAA